MLALETLVGTRVVATPDAINECVSLLPDTMTALRFADDEVFLYGKGQIELTDEHAIVEREVGFSAARLSPKQFTQLIADRLEWELPPTRPCFTQGRFLALPVKLWITDDHTLVIVASAYAHELGDRLR